MNRRIGSASSKDGWLLLAIIFTRDKWSLSLQPKIGIWDTNYLSHSLSLSLRSWVCSNNLACRRSAQEFLLLAMALYMAWPRFVSQFLKSPHCLYIKPPSKLQSIPKYTLLIRLDKNFCVFPQIKLPISLTERKWTPQIIMKHRCSFFFNHTCVIFFTSYIMYLCWNRCIGGRGFFILPDVLGMQT